MAAWKALARVLGSRHPCVIDPHSSDWLWGLNHDGMTMAPLQRLLSYSTHGPCLCEVIPSPDFEVEGNLPEDIIPIRGTW